MSRRVLVVAVLLSVVLGPALGVAADDLSASSGPRHHAGLRHQPARGWRTLPGLVEGPAYLPPVTGRQRLDLAEPACPFLLLIRTPFVPPRS
jgi:hypothetical protein